MPSDFRSQNETAPKGDQKLSDNLNLRSNASKRLPGLPLDDKAHVCACKALKSARKLSGN